MTIYDLQVNAAKAPQDCDQVVLITFFFKILFPYRAVAVEELEKSSWKMSVVSPQAYEITAEHCPDTKVSVCVSESETEEVTFFSH